MALRFSSDSLRFRVATASRAANCSGVNFISDFAVADDSFVLWRRFDASSLRRLSSASCFLRSAASSRAASCSDVKAWLLLLFVDASFSFIMALCWRIASSCAAFFARRSAAVSLALEGRADARPAPKELWRAPNVLRSFETWPGFVDLTIEDVRGLIALDALPSAGGCGRPCPRAS